MSETKSRFRMKKGDIEIEYEALPAEVSSKFKEIFEWLKETTASAPKAKDEVTVTEETSIETKAGQKQHKRGGARSSVVSSAIDILISEGFLDTFKSSSLIMEELKRKTIPVSGIAVVQTSLNRKVPKKLDRIKDEQGKWVYKKRPERG
jgi:hypothetical protein